MVNCVLRISGLYTSRLLDAAFKKVLNLPREGLLVYEEAKTTSTRHHQPQQKLKLHIYLKPVSYSKFGAKTFRNLERKLKQCRRVLGQRKIRLTTS
ncbi:hypothetical protein Tco_0438001 [Tanacetum coccineum]|uniref:Uncharacterized protein n=1 Tax=Tanacetum coccineum TaxID=301880 RepID=A0ABQ4ZIY7_9ASTR